MGTGRRRPGVLAAAAVLGAALLVGGCSGEGGGSRSSQDAAAAPAVAQAPKADPGAAGKNAVPGSGAGAGAAPAQPSAVATADTRLIAYTAQLALLTDDVEKAAQQARSLTAGAGGYVGKETVSGSAGSGRPGGDADGHAMTGQIVLKVPSSSYQQVLDGLAGLGQVLSRSSQADDLTQQAVDVASRLQSQQASVERVRALMSEARSLSDIVSLESELSRRQADLESLQRQQQELVSRTSLSTITLNLQRETAAPLPVAEKKDGFWASVGSALGGGWHVLGAIVKGLLVALAAVSPFLLVLGPLGWMIWFVNRRGAARKASRPAPAEASDPWTAPHDGPDEQ
ncbi:DUF4349 domain-containing protein [Kitasatospora sp. NPDC057223]|uniref:DUF4349 domain-containing protein n=1 Tax=Kitasatospora sp. NPDC057223 TaxID=3346055 RepID=UPI003624E58E